MRTAEVRMMLLSAIVGKYVLMRLEALRPSLSLPPPPLLLPQPPSVAGLAP